MQLKNLRVVTGDPIASWCFSFPVLMDAGDGANDCAALKVSAMHGMDEFPRLLAYISGEPMPTVSDLG